MMYKIIFEIQDGNKSERPNLFSGKLGASKEKRILLFALICMCDKWLLVRYDSKYIAVIKVNRNKCMNNLLKYSLTTLVLTEQSTLTGKTFLLNILFLFFVETVSIMKFHRRCVGELSGAHRHP